jgi:hypothetical protein
MWLSIIRGYKHVPGRQDHGPPFPALTMIASCCWAHARAKFQDKLPQVTNDKPHLCSNLLQEGKKNNLPNLLKRFRLLLHCEKIHHVSVCYFVLFLLGSTRCAWSFPWRRGRTGAPRSWRRRGSRACRCSSSARRSGPSRGGCCRCGWPASRARPGAVAAEAEAQAPPTTACSTRRAWRSPSGGRAGEAAATSSPPGGRGISGSWPEVLWSLESLVGVAFNSGVTKVVGGIDKGKVLKLIDRGIMQ